MEIRPRTYTHKSQRKRSKVRTPIIVQPIKVPRRIKLNVKHQRMLSTIKLNSQDIFTEKVVRMLWRAVLQLSKKALTVGPVPLCASPLRLLVTCPTDSSKKVTVHSDANHPFTRPSKMRGFAFDPLSTRALKSSMDSISSTFLRKTWPHCGGSQRREPQKNSFRKI